MTPSDLSMSAARSFGAYGLVFRVGFGGLGFWAAKHGAIRYIVFRTRFGQIVSAKIHVDPVTKARADCRTKFGWFRV